MVNKTILKEAKGKVLVRVEFPLFADVQAHAHEFWISKEAYVKSQDAELTDSEQQASSPQVRVEYGWTDDAAIHKFNELLGLEN